MGDIPEGYVNGCKCQIATESDKIKKDDPIQEHYKKTGMWGSFTGMFGDKKTMWCHHVTSDGEIGPRAAKAAGKTFTTPEEIWEFLGKKQCCGRFAYDSSTKMLVCGNCIKADHDNTCNKETCLFIASGLPCPTPTWAFK
eukprot:gnl/TRDRNA2_/TRDRNA2_196783_c0_seq1.p2 gnl/TRDRNA2_/TRDRNA2_196783_c0~~gnl/TRDRNA2_/TRDRNA2_196783_c0_seq1.p2  ORF type:complete len:163 (+),score=25.45 gnl/TRDRNA2_/TRDRNA2_196783_c0_seq1:71-490(+)